MGGKEALRSSKNAGQSSRDKDKGKGREKAAAVQSKGKGKGKANAAYDDDELVSSSLPSQSLTGAGAQFQYAQITASEDVQDETLPQSSSGYGYSQSAPPQRIAYAPQYGYDASQQAPHVDYTSRQTSSVNYNYPPAAEQKYTYSSANLTADLGALNIFPTVNQDNQYTTTQNTYNTFRPTSYATARGNSSTNPQGGQYRDTRQRSHGNKTNIATQKQALKDNRVQMLLGKEKYSEHRTKDFEPGRILKIFWFEPKGGRGGGSGGSRVSGGGATLRAHMESQGKVRRFVIVETRKGHSTAIPIQTYKWQGCNKPGCHAEDHAMIYSSRQPPPYLPGEKERGIIHPKIRMAAVSGELLDDESRVNYAKKYTIEHNFLVSFIGRIHKESVDDFWYSFNYVNQDLLSQSLTGNERHVVSEANASRNNMVSSVNSTAAQASTSQQLLRQFDSTPTYGQPIQEEETTLESEPPVEPFQDPDPTPMNTQPSSSRRNDRGHGDRRERREHREYRY